MERKLLSLGQLSDIFGFRVIVGTVDQVDFSSRRVTATGIGGSKSTVRLWPYLLMGALGLVMLEAMACGVPVVAGDSGGVRSAVRDGETGLVIAAEDAPGLPFHDRLVAERVVGVDRHQSPLAGLTTLLI